MARILTVTFEPRLVQGDGLTSTGTVAFDTTNQFDGTVCAKCAKGADNRFTYTKTLTTGTTYYMRGAFKAASVAPSSNLGLIRISAASAIELTLNTDGKIYIWNALKSVNVLSGVFKPEAEKYYLYEVKVLVPAAGNGTLALRIYSSTGVTLYESGDQSVEIGTTAISAITAGHVGTDTAIDVYASHFAMNDSTGENENSWLGFGKVGELKPVEDGERVGWTTPGGGTTNLWKALDNRPPEGIADTTSEANKEKQIRDANNNSTDTYIAKLGAYSDALGSGGGGLGEADTIVLTQPRARGANTTTTSRLLAVRSESNPGPDTEVTLESGTTTAGTDPTGWSTVFGTVTYSPTIVKSTKPGVRVRKGTASTNTLLYDMVGLVFEYIPHTTYAISVSESLSTSDSVTRNITGTRAINDSLTLSEAATRSFVGTRKPTETLSTSDSNTAPKTVSRGNSDSITAIDSSSRSINSSRNLNESLSLIDVTVRSFIGTRKSTESLTTNETTSRSTSRNRSIADSLSTSDSSVRSLGYGRSPNENISTVTSPYPTTLTGTTGLVSAWELGETSGSALDLMSLNPGTYNGSPARGQASLLTNGEGHSVMLTPTTQFISVPNSASLNVGDTFSLEAIIRPNSPTTTQGIISKGSESYYMRVSASAKLELLKSQKAGIAVANEVLLKETPYYVLITKSGSTIKMYQAKLEVGAVLKDVTGEVVNSTIVNNTQALSIGGDTGFTTERWNGFIQYAAVYNVALSRETAEAHLKATWGSSSKDTVSRSMSINRSIEQTLSTNDSVTALKVVFKNVSESLSTSDTVSRATAAARKVGESLTTSDSVSRIFTGVRSITQLLTTSDAVTRTIGLKRVIAEATSTIDSVKRQVVANRSIADILTTNDTQKVNANASRSVTENLSTTDSVNRLKGGFSRFANEVYATTEIPTRVANLFRTIIDSVTGSDQLGLDVRTTYQADQEVDLQITEYRFDLEIADELTVTAVKPQTYISEVGENELRINALLDEVRINRPDEDLYLRQTADPKYVRSGYDDKLLVELEEA